MPHSLPQQKTSQETPQTSEDMGSPASLSRAPRYLLGLLESISHPVFFMRQQAVAKEAGRGKLGYDYAADVSNELGCEDSRGLFIRGSTDDECVRKLKK
jgi:hypothetical protein